jgi:ABC-type transporter Mla MlaB component
LIRIGHISDGTPSHLLVEGKLTDGWVDVLETSWLEAQSEFNGQTVRVDLSGVIYVDHKGRALLERMIRSGTKVQATGLMLKGIIDEITTEGVGAELDGGPRR